MIWTIRIHVQSCSIPEPHLRRLETPCKSNAIMKIASAYALVVRSVDELNGEQISVQNMKGADRRTRSKRAWFFVFGLQELRIFTKHRWLPHRMNASTMAPRRIWPGPAECAEPFAGGRRKKDQQWDPVQLCPNKGVGFNRSARPHLQIKHSVCELQSLQCKQSCGYSHWGVQTPYTPAGSSLNMSLWAIRGPNHCSPRMCKKILSYAQCSNLRFCYCFCCGYIGNLSNWEGIWAFGRELSSLFVLTIKHNQFIDMRTILWTCRDFTSDSLMAKRIPCNLISVSLYS